MTIEITSTMIARIVVLIPRSCARGCGGPGPSADTDDMLDAFYSFAEGVESRGKVAQWAAEAWQQPADWGHYGSQLFKVLIVRPQVY